MSLTQGQRVKLTQDIALADAVAGPSGAVIGFLSLPAGTTGTVERIDDQTPESHEVREYERLTSLLHDYGHTMPEASKSRLEEEIATLEPHWTAHQQRGTPATVRVRLDNGFVLDSTDQTYLTAL
ncbi:hypothetical protein [Streptomyces sp. Caat 7-52]|uniref:hypothetical protein n=1 Tax=Streptomyces sp. Caat 7-52 TaxID=2949637 RepID=UPI002034FD7B|nr:hypothetical protein [Streptomyces sp. Caat 7-52]